MRTKKNMYWHITIDYFIMKEICCEARKLSFRSDLKSENILSNMNNDIP